MLHFLHPTLRKLSHNHKAMSKFCLYLRNDVFVGYLWICVSVYIFLHMFDWENNYWLFLFTIAIISIELYFSLFEQDSLFWDSPSSTHHKIENWKCQYTFLGTLADPDVYHQSVVPVSSLQSSHHPVPGLGEGLCSDGFCLDEEVMVSTLYGLEGLVVTAWHLVKFLSTILISVTSYRNVWSKPCQ